MFLMGTIQDPMAHHLTGIKVTWTQNLGGYQINVGTARAGFENEIDADGGTNLATITTSASLVDLSALDISWDSRYNYRIGCANIYRVTEIILYKDGAIGESQTSLTLDSNIGSLKEGHAGWNIDPSNRNNTHIATAKGVGYTKVDLLTAIKVTWTQNVGVYYTAGTARAGFENQTDADGGTNLKNLTSGSVIDLTSLSINWSDRYNYRIGGANIYRITEIILYKNGSVAESQTSLMLNSGILVGKEGHMGANINPSSRNVTKYETAAGVGYQKWIT